MNRSVHLLMYVSYQLLERLDEKLTSQIHMLLPSLGELRHIVSRLGQVASEVKVSANNVSSFQLDPCVI